jgi:hypothetical protein
MLITQCLGASCCSGSGPQRMRSVLHNCVKGMLLLVPVSCSHLMQLKLTVLYQEVDRCWKLVETACFPVAAGMV